MQYFLMAAFCWMLVEGIHLYLLVVKVYNVNNKMTMYYVMSWGRFSSLLLLMAINSPCSLLDTCKCGVNFCLTGFPAVMVAISLSIAAAKGGIKSFVSDE